MKTVFDTMFWVSFLTHRHGARWRLIERARRARIRLFVSDYLLDEVAKVLLEVIGLLHDSLNQHGNAGCVVLIRRD